MRSLWTVVMAMGAGIGIGLWAIPAQSWPKLSGPSSASLARLWQSLSKSAGGGDERWQHGNLVQVRLGSTWHDLPLMPLADHLCARRPATLQRHCDVPDVAGDR